MQSKYADRIPGAQDSYLPVLDGLRFVAAMSVAGGHYAGLLGQGPLPEALGSFTGLGMTLFFVLSGFVIHYNYHATIQKADGLRLFLAARFARLYPLYIILFLVEFSYLVIAVRTPCGRIGEPEIQFVSLPYFLTLTQSWFYTVTCGKSLIYQYGPISAVSWSISVEVFFYLAYAAGVRLFGRFRPTPFLIIGCAFAIYLLTVCYFGLSALFQEAIDSIGHAAFGPAASTVVGYNDSFLRWLLYFNPVARLAEFTVGMAAAQVYLKRRMIVPEAASGWLSLATLAAIVTVIGAHLWLYLGLAPISPFIGRIASPLYGPLVAILMYCLVRYVTPWSQGLSHPLLVRLGEASYSIYLLHEIFPSAFKRLGIEAVNPLTAWALWTVSLVMLAIVSRQSYLKIERPARLAVRRVLAPSLAK